MGKLNRMANSQNKWQGSHKKVLCVCSAGLLRSPTAALVLSQEPFNFNTRAAGITTDFALVAVDEVLIYWADEIVCMEREQAFELEDKFEDLLKGKKIIILDIPDSYAYRDPEMMALIKKQYQDSEIMAKAQDEKTTGTVHPSSK